MQPSEKIPPAKNPIPKLDPTSIYPTVPERHSPEDANTPVDPLQLDNNEKQRSLISVFIKTFAKFLIGLIGITLLGLVLGYLTKGPVVAATGYFSGLTNAFLSILYLLPLTIFFGFIAYAKKEYILAAYPLIVFLFGKSLMQTQLAGLLRSYYPFLSESGKPDFHLMAIISALVFATLYVIERPITHIIKLTHKGGPSAEKERVAYVVIFVLVLVSFPIIRAGSHSLLISTIRTRDKIRIPSSDTYFGKNSGEIYDNSIKYSVTSISYNEATAQYDGAYQQVDTVKTRPITKWWDNDTKANCGSQTSAVVTSRQTAKYSYKKTKKNVVYAETSFTGNNSQPQKKSSEFTEYHSCFVLGYQKYVFVRSDARGSEYLNTYPTPDIIDAIAAGELYIPRCLKSVYNQKQSTTSEEVCSTADSEQISKVNLTFQKRYSKPQPARKTTGIITPTINPSAYKEVARLEIKEWGISLPLNEDIKDAYYYSGVNSNGKEMFTIGLKSFTSDRCFAGPASQNASGSGIAFISRNKVSEMKFEPNVSTEGKVAGDYAYSLYVNGNSKRCLEFMQKSGEMRTTYEDIFDWSEAGIR